MRTSLRLMLLAAVVFGLMAGESSVAQEVGPGPRPRPGPGAGGIVDSGIEVVRPDGGGGGQLSDVGSARDLIAASKDRVWLQKSLRRRWDAAGPEERNKMLDAQRKLSKGKLDGLTDGARGDLLKKRMESRPVMLRDTGKPVIGESFAKKPSSPIMSADQRRLLRERVRDLSPEQRQLVRDRMTELRALDEVDQAILREQLQDWLNLSQEDRAQLDAYRERWEGMTPEQQDAMRLRMLRLREMSEGQREELLQRAIGDGPEGLP